MPKMGMNEKISNISIKWEMGAAPFFAEFLLRFVYREDKNCPTMGVGIRRRKVFLSYNKEWVDKITDKECEGVLVHEIMHLIHRFQARQEDRDHKIFNVAQDACINKTVLETSINGNPLVLPEEGVRIEQISGMGYKGEVISEPIYDFLYERADKIYIAQPGEGGGKGSGSQGDNDNDPSKGKEILSTIDDHSGLNKKDGKGAKEATELDDLEKEVVQEIINSARLRQWGNVSGNIVGEIKELIKTREIPWRRKLSMYLSKYVYDPGNIYENTWSRRNRRELPLPGIRKKSKKIVVTVDTSGSIGDDDIKAFFGQIEKIVKDYSQMTLIQWDTAVKNVSQYRKGDWRKIKVHGRGGTDVQDLYNHVHEKMKNTSILVNFTDGYFNWDIDHYGIPTIWVFNGEFEGSTFGRKINIIDNDR